MKSIRRQLNVTLLAGLFVLFAAASTGLYLYTRGAFIRQFDESLFAKLASLSKLSETEERSGLVIVELEFDAYPLPEFQPSPHADYYQVWQEDASVLARSASLGGKDLPRQSAPAGPVPFRKRKWAKNCGGRSGFRSERRRLKKSEYGDEDSLRMAGRPFEDLRPLLRPCPGSSRQGLPCFRAVYRYRRGKEVGVGRAQPSSPKSVSITLSAQSRRTSLGEDPSTSPAQFITRSSRVMRKS